MASTATVTGPFLSAFIMAEHVIALEKPPILYGP